VFAQPSSGIERCSDFALLAGAQLTTFPFNLNFLLSTPFQQNTSRGGERNTNLHLHSPCEKKAKTYRTMQQTKFGGTSLSSLKAFK
jgi:hypothetical protein